MVHSTYFATFHGIYCIMVHTFLHFRVYHGTYFPRLTLKNLSHDDTTCHASLWPSWHDDNSWFSLDLSDPMAVFTAMPMAASIQSDVNLVCDRTGTINSDLNPGSYGTIAKCLSLGWLCRINATWMINKDKFLKWNFPRKVKAYGGARFQPMREGFTYICNIIFHPQRLCSVTTPDFWENRGLIQYKDTIIPI